MHMQLGVWWESVMVQKLYGIFISSLKWNIYHVILSPLSTSEQKSAFHGCVLCAVQKVSTLVLQKFGTHTYTTGLVLIA